jgi:Fe2+ transport system protein FeoA
MPRDAHIGEIRPLTELMPGERGTVAELEAGNGDGTMPKLLALGILPGCRVEMLQRFPSFLFRIGHTQVATDRRIAGAVRVRRSTCGARPAFLATLRDEVVETGVDTRRATRGRRRRT